MSGIRVCSLCVLLLSASGLGAQQVPVPPTTVDDLVRTGIQNNQDLAAVRQRIAEAKGLVRQAGVRPSPTLGANGASGRPLGTVGENQYSVQYSQSIETYGKRAKRINAAGFSVGTAEADLRERSAQLAFEIRAAFAQVAAERRKIKLLDVLSAVNQDALRLTEARVNEGDAAPLEANLLRVEISQSNVLRASALGRLASSELELRRLIGLEPSIAIPNGATPTQAPLSLDSLKQRAMEDRADLKSARFSEEQARAETALARAEAKPDLTFSGGYTRQHSQFDGLFAQTVNGSLAPIKEQNDILTFGISLPLRTSRSNQGNVEAAAARTSGARLHREYLERTIPLEVEAAYQRWTVATSSLETLRNGVINPSTANLAVIREAYKSGQLRLLDVLNEQRRLVDAQLAYIDVQADAARSWAEVQRAIGGDLP
jgi:cobalt-zinc-cadmium efflux system outer membrane protein